MRSRMGTSGVAQTSSLLYRGFLICRALNNSERPVLSCALPTGSLRYEFRPATRAAAKYVSDIIDQHTYLSLLSGN